MDENELVRQLREGDEKAAAFLVSLLGSKLVGYARDIAGDLSDTDRLLICDIAVETAIRRIDRYDAERASLERWMRAFVRHAAMDWRRSHHRLDELRDDDGLSDGGGDERRSPAGSMSKSQPAANAICVRFEDSHASSKPMNQSRQFCGSHARGPSDFSTQHRGGLK